MNEWLIVSVLFNVILLAAVINAEVGWANAQAGWDRALEARHRIQDWWRWTIDSLEDAHRRIAELESERDIVPGDDDSSEAWKRG